MITNMCILAANYIVERTNKFNEGKNYSDRISLTCKRLQKLLYFSDIEYMKKYGGESMFSDEFHAWPSGPVIPSVYDEFVQYQNGEMVPVNEEGHTPITDEMREILDNVFDQTIEIDTYDLVDMSHAKGGPWHKAYDDSDEHHEQVISKDEMLAFYKGRNIFERV